MPVRYTTSPPRSKPAASFYAAYFAVLGVAGPFLGPYLDGRGVGAVGVGLITAAFSLAKLAYAPFLGVAVDRGRWFRGILVAHVGLSVAAALALWSISGAWGLGVAFLVLGVGYGAVLPLVEAAVLERGVGSGYGRLRLWGSIGFVVAAIGSARLLAGDPVARFPAVLATVLALLGLACLPVERQARPPARPHPAPIPPLLWALLAVLTLNQVAHGPYYAFFSIDLLAHGYAGIAVGLLWSVGVVAELGAFLVGGRLERRLGLRRLIGLALAVTPVRWALLALPPSPPTLVLAQLGHAASFAIVHLAGVQLVQRIAPPAAVRYVQALYSGLCFGLGIVVGSALSGPLYAAAGGRGAFAAAAVLSTLLLVVWRPLSRRLAVSRASAAAGGDALLRRSRS